MAKSIQVPDDLHTRIIRLKEPYEQMMREQGKLVGNLRNADVLYPAVDCLESILGLKEECNEGKS